MIHHGKGEAKCQVSPGRSGTRNFQANRCSGAVKSLLTPRERLK